MNQPSHHHEPHKTPSHTESTKSTPPAANLPPRKAPAPPDEGVLEAIHKDLTAVSGVVRGLCDVLAPDLSQKDCDDIKVVLTEVANRLERTCQDPNGPVPHGPLPKAFRRAD